MIETLHFSWQSQASQYPKIGRPGIRYEQHKVPIAQIEHRQTGAKVMIESDRPIDALVYRNRKGHVVGLLWHYPVDMPPWQKAGDVNLFVRPDRQRRGIGRALLAEALQRWSIDFAAQDYTPEGFAFVEAVTGIQLPRAEEAPT